MGWNVPISCSTIHLHKSGKSFMITQNFISPHDLAEAIGASESSVRRWIDAGELRISRTKGGHRRVPLREALRLVRRLGVVVVRPELLNLPGGTTGARDTAEQAHEQLLAALTNGEEQAALRIAVGWFLGGQALHELFDGALRAALHRIGEMWKHDSRGILIEHRATEIALSVIVQLRALLPEPAQGAPLAIGAAPAGDPYQVTSQMAGITLAEAGWREINFGANTPLRLLASEADARGAELVWLSVSHLDHPSTVGRDVQDLAASLAAKRISLVLGGRHANEIAPRQSDQVMRMSSMGELAAFARGYLNQRVPVAPRRARG
jgi:excisionase family DNA binding protein